MSELTKKTEYGLKLMIGLAKKYGSGPISLKKITKEEKLPYRFSSQVALILKKNGLLKTKEGARGGYFLAESPAKIKIAEILEALEGPVHLVECLKRESACPWYGTCGQKKMFEQQTGILKKIMKAHSLADLI